MFSYSVMWTAHGATNVEIGASATGNLVYDIFRVAEVFFSGGGHSGLLQDVDFRRVA